MIFGYWGRKPGFEFFGHGFRKIFLFLLIFVFASASDAQTLLSPAVALQGTLTSVAQVDAYQIVLPADGKVDVTFTHSPFMAYTTAMWLIRVLTTNGVEVMAFVSGQTDGSLTVPVGLPAGTYRIEVKPLQITSTSNALLNVAYQLKYTLTQATQTHAFELQTGDPTTPPTPVKQDVIYTGSLASHTAGTVEIDRWSISLATAGNVLLKFEHEPLSIILGYWLVSIKTVDGTELLSFRSGQSNGSLTLPIGLPAGTFEVQVSIATGPSSYMQSIQNIPYQLSYAFIPATASNAFEQQTGVATSTPTPTSANVNYTGSLASHVAGVDVDRWSLVLSQAGNLELNFQHDIIGSVTGAWKVTLKTEFGTDILSFLSGQTDGNLTVPVGLPAGKYLVDVAPNTSNGTVLNIPYHLNYTFTPSEFFEKELNDSSATATPLLLNTTYSGAIQPYGAGIDYFGFTLDYTHNLQLKLLPESIPATAMTLVLTNLDTNTVVYTARTIGVNTVVKAPAGRYAVSVAGSSGSLGAPYSLTVHDLGQAIQHTFTLGKGWNLLGNSFDAPIAAADFAAGNSATVVSMWKWDAVHTQWQFYAPGMTSTELASYAQSKGYAVLTQIGPREGFWVNVSDVSSSQVFTLVPTVLGSDDLHIGWNLVASGGNLDPRQLNSRFGSEPPAYAPDPLTAAARPANLQTLWAWSNVASQWYFYAPSLDQPSASALQTYTSGKNYLNFYATSVPQTLGLGTGFWVNK